MLALPRSHGAEALTPFQRLSRCFRPEAVSLRTLECFRVSQNVGQDMALLLSDKRTLSQPY